MNYIVIKTGGSVLEKLPNSFYKNLVKIQKEGQYQPVIVHGGGPLISTLLTKLGIEPDFIDGLRVTSAEVLQVVEMVLSGSVNKDIVSRLQLAGGEAYGISGVDGKLMEAESVAEKEELGLVGQVVKVKKELIEEIIAQGQIPVISPVSVTKDGQKLNVNGDVAASAVAKALGGRLVFISDIPGIYVKENGQEKIFHELYAREAEELISQGVITGGMIPKVRAAIDGLTHNVKQVIILNGLEENSLNKYLADEKIGSKIMANEVNEHAE